MSFVRCAIASICFRYSSVYCTDAPSGATTKVKKNPRSSAGTNSRSSALKSSTADAVSNTPPAMTMDGRAASRDSSRTYPFVMPSSTDCTTLWNARLARRHAQDLRRQHRRQRQRHDARR